MQKKGSSGRLEGRDQAGLTQCDLALKLSLNVQGFAVQRAQPLLPGRRPARQSSTSSASAKPLARLVSVPLPPPARSQDGASAAAEPPKDLVTDLMAFGSGEAPHYSAPAKSLSQPQPQQRDVFADLEALVPSVSLFDSDRGFGTAPSGVQHTVSTAASYLPYPATPLNVRGLF